MDFKEQLIKLIKKEVKSDFNLEIPPSQELGDFALPCFSLAKELKTNPVEIAKQLSKKFSANFIEKVEVKGPYINFFLKKSSFIETIIPKSLEKDFGKEKQGKKILVEFPSPNTNKPLHLGHARNIALGISISRILEFLGNKVVKVNLNNDRGIHICKSMLAYKLFGKNKKPNKKSDHFVGDFYVLFSKWAEKDKSLEDKAQEMLRLWESGDKSTVALWKKMNSWALNGFKETYKKFNLEFDKVYNESDFYDKAKNIIQEYVKKGLFKVDDDGSTIIDLEPYNLGKKVLIRADGTSIYITQDLYLAMQKYKDFKMDKSVYVVGSEQIHHFKVLLKIFELMKLPFAKSCYPIHYGLVYLPSGKMKSREGTVVDADDILSEIESLAKKEITKRYQKLPKKEIEERSKIIGMAALKFYLLKSDTVSDIHFNPEESISFEGETGPYVQYTIARINSILKKLCKDIKKADLSLLKTQEEFQIAKLISDFPSVVKESGEKLKPYLIARLLLELSKLFNSYYQSTQILNQEESLRNSRILLIKAVKNILVTGLGLLGIESLEEM